MARHKLLGVAEAKSRFSELVRRAAGGEEIVIAHNGEPKARLVALPPRRLRRPGRGAGKWKVADDFNDSLATSFTPPFQAPT